MFDLWDERGRLNIQSHIIIRTGSCMVGGLFAMCTGQVSLLVYTMWLFGVVNFGNYEVFLRESWSNTVSLSIIMSL